MGLTCGGRWYDGVCVHMHNLLSTTSDLLHNLQESWIRHTKPSLSCMRTMQCRFAHRSATYLQTRDWETHDVTLLLSPAEGHRIRERHHDGSSYLKNRVSLACRSLQSWTVSHVGMIHKHAAMIDLHRDVTRCYTPWSRIHQNHVARGRTPWQPFFYIRALIYPSFALQSTSVRTPLPSKWRAPR